MRAYLKKSDIRLDLNTSFLMLRRRLLKRYYAFCCFMIFLLSFIINFQINYLNDNADFTARYNIAMTQPAIRDLHMDITPEYAAERAAALNADPGELMVVALTLSDYEITPEILSAITAAQFVRQRNRLVRFFPEEFTQLCSLYNGLLADMQVFPVPVSSDDFPWVNFVNSWGYERTYGGERAHEGTDIMAECNQANIYPVLSVCDGTVANMGWLELGGYRIGITSESGIYYYYAHLASYASGLKVGDPVSAGELLGFMGNTGYSKVEGTSGKFDVHLHFGIYITTKEGEELAYNPYYFLKNLKNKVLYYHYKI